MTETKVLIEQYLRDTTESRRMRKRALKRLRRRARHGDQMAIKFLTFVKEMRHAVEKSSVIVRTRAPEPPAPPAPEPFKLKLKPTPAPLAPEAVAAKVDEALETTFAEAGIKLKIGKP